MLSASGLALPPELLTRGFAPGPRWRLCPQTPARAPRSPCVLLAPSVHPTVFDLATPLTITVSSTNWKPVRDFLLVNNTNLHPISHRLQVIADYLSNLQVRLKGFLSLTHSFGVNSEYWIVTYSETSLSRNPPPDTPTIRQLRTTNELAKIYQVQHHIQEHLNCTK